MTISFGPLESTTDYATGAHSRRLRTYGSTVATAVTRRYATGTHDRALRSLGLVAGANGDAGTHRRRLRHYGSATGAGFDVVYQYSAGTHARGISSAGVPYSGALETDPEVPATGLHARQHYSAGETYSDAYAEGEHSRRLRSFGYASPASYAGGTHRRAVSTWGRYEDAQAGTALLVAQPFHVSSYGGQWFENLRSRVAVGGGLASLPTAVIRDAFTVTLGATPQASTTKSVQERVAFSSPLHAVLFSSISELLLVEVAAAETPQRINRLVERVLLSGYVQSLAEASQAVVELLVLRAMLDAFLLETVTESLLSADTVAGLYTANASIVEQALMASPLDSTLSMTVLVDEQVVAASNAATEAEAAVLVRESIGLVAHFSVDNGEYVAWLLNTESKGLSTYTNYPFNSFFEVGGKWIGVTGAGLYTLGGDDDDGEAIDARLRLGMQSLGSRMVKHIPEAFIGYTGDGRLILRLIIVADGSGEKVAADYRMKPRPAGAKRESRFEPGKGVQAVDFDFEIENIDGGDFDISSIEFYPLAVGRRTRG